MLSAALSVIAGLAVGVGYGLCGIRSPAPPAIALWGCSGCWQGNAASVWPYTASATSFTIPRAPRRPHISPITERPKHRESNHAGVE
jgi:XapX domain-containing protein